MKPVHALGSSTLALAIAALLVPSPGEAQLSNTVLDRQHDQAIALAYGGAPGAIEQAVLRHGLVVQQRMPNDARRYECLKSHANLLYYYGHLDGARLYMEAAAEQAARDGRDYDAAMTFIDAALLAKEAGDRRAVLNLANRASLLGTSSRLDDGQRAEILARISE